MYDSAFRVYVVYALLVSTDFALVERASWVVVGVILRPLAAVAFAELQSLEEFFFFRAGVIFCLPRVYVFYHFVVGDGGVAPSGYGTFIGGG